MLIRTTTPEMMGTISKVVRKSQNMDQTTAGAFSGSSINFVSQFERGKPTVQLGRVLELLNALGIEVLLNIPDSVSQDMLKFIAKEVWGNTESPWRQTLISDSPPKQAVSDYFPPWERYNLTWGSEKAKSKLDNEFSTLLKGHYQDNKDKK
ncbi:helix-turn-helix domain-containing protein [Idiomarina seosinensis]|uniref:helix-turn-helix domain-containing protein n=1 Tax=Idiomarina seosinensis TaxID=281739 RepID=UPI0018E4ED6A|nr:helix-turn-helix domain-containing protein [Idiomarina seosinensis]